MNKNLLIAAAAVLILVLAGGGYFLFARKAAPSPVVAPEGAKPTGTAGGTFMKSLKDLLLSGVAQKCTYSVNEAGNTASGTTYIASGKMRADVTSTTENKTVNTHVIYADKTSYMWMEGQKTGYKMTFDPTTFTANVTPPTGQAGGSQAIDMNKNMNLNCSPGGVDTSLFTPPTDVTFTDFSSMMPTGAKMMPTGGSQQGGNPCSACNSLSGDTKTQCLKALNCQ